LLLLEEILGTHASTSWTGLWSRNWKRKRGEVVWTAKKRKK